MNTRETLCIKDNNLMIGSFTAVELAKKFQTPLYVMDADYLRRVASSYVLTMKGYGDGAVCYASKAFLTIATTRLLAKEGMWFDSVSAGEIYALNKAGIDMSHVMFHGNNKTPKEIDLALELGVGYFVIDSYSEIENLENACEKKGINQKVLIRVNPCVSAHTFAAVSTAAPNSKFGFNIDTEAIKVAKLIKTHKHLDFEGFHMHIGSQIYDHTAYDLAIEKIVKLYKEAESEGIEIKTLDLGGGYGIYYTDEDPKFEPERYSDILKNILDKLTLECEKNALKKPFVIVEPGRSVVGEAGVTLYTVGAIKDFPGVKKYVAIDGGMFENPRFALYESKYSAIVCNKANEEQVDTVTIAGKCCESGDIIGENIKLQKAEIGDTIAVFSTGAYNYSMASNYNFNPIPPVVLVDHDKADYIVKPQTYEDLVRRDEVPEWI